MLKAINVPGRDREDMEAILQEILELSKLDLNAAMDIAIAQSSSENSTRDLVVNEMATVCGKVSMLAAWLSRAHSENARDWFRNILDDTIGYVTGVAFSNIYWVLRRSIGGP